MQNNNTNNKTATTIKLKKNHTIAITTVLIVVCCIVGAYVTTYALRPSGYHEMYLQDTQTQANSYPRVLVINQNNTFSMPVVVTNNTPNTQEYRVQVKIVQVTFTFPVDAPAYKTYEFVLDAKQSWDNQIPITINEEGAYSIVFELYAKNGEGYGFTDNYCVLHAEAIVGIV
jgi:uncharacterized membrane protein